MFIVSDSVIVPLTISLCTCGSYMSLFLDLYLSAAMYLLVCLCHVCVFVCSLFIGVFVLFIVFCVCFVCLVGCFV